MTAHRIPFFDAYAPDSDACMFHDELGLLARDRGLPPVDRPAAPPRTWEPPPEAWVARREGRAAVALRGSRRPTRLEVGHRIDASADGRVPFHEFLRVVARIDAALGDPSRPRGRSFELACHSAFLRGPGRMGRVSRDPEGYLEAALRDLAAARAAMAPFLATLTPGAVSMAMSGPLGRSDVAAYALLDPTFDPEAPLARAWESAPDLKACAANLARKSPAALRRAVAQGPAALERALDEVAASLVTGVGSHRAGVLSRRFLAAREAMDAATAATVTRKLGIWAVAHEDLAVSVARLLCPLPPERVPVDVAGWVAFADCSLAVGMAIRISGPGKAHLRLGKDEGWPRFRARLVEPHGGDLAAVAQAILGVDDMVDALRREVAAPAVAIAGLHRSHASPLAHAVTRGDRGVLAILALSARWHRDGAAMSLALQDPDRVVAVWPRCLPDATYAGIRIVEILDAAGLAEEGRRGLDPTGRAGLAHCVGGYAERCVAGSSRILSVGTSGGERLSTAEVTWDDGIPALAQHRGERNAVPPTEAVDALEAYVADLVDGRLPWNRPDPIPVPELTGPDACGYDWRRPGAWERARDAWSFLLPRRSRGADATTFAAYPDRPEDAGVTPRTQSEP